MSVLKSIFRVPGSECQVYVSATGELGGERDTSSQGTSGNAKGAEIGVIFFFN